jgi:hypothetical protein
VRERVFAEIARWTDAYATDSSDPAVDVRARNA